MKVLVIVGPTASGKSDLAVRLAKEFNGEAISADSRQVYQGLDIGTGKITKREMKGVPHHLLDVTTLSNKKSRNQPRGLIAEFTVADYQKLAQEKITDISTRGKLPILCGGTGLYIQAALGELTIPVVPPNLKLRKKLEKKSVAELFKILRKLDPKRASNIDAQNPRRLVRAIEIATAAKTLGVGASLTPSVKTATINYNTFWIGLNPGQEILRQKIKARLQKRLKNGLIEEVRTLHEKNKISWQRLEELGLEYRYVARYLRGLISKIEMLAQLELAIWHYAKRQMTWFKRNHSTKLVASERIHWLVSADEVKKLKPRIVRWRSQPRAGNTGTKR